MAASSDTVSGQDIGESKPGTSAAEIDVTQVESEVCQTLHLSRHGTDMKFNKTIHQTMGAMYMFNSSSKCSLACPSGYYKLPSKCVFFSFFFFISYIQLIFLKNMPVQHHPLIALLNYRKNHSKHQHFLPSAECASQRGCFRWFFL